MKSLVVIFGGDSVEHDISVLTGLHCARHITDDYRVILVYLTRTGQMVTSGACGTLSQVDNYTSNRIPNGKVCFFANGSLFRKSAFGIRKVCTPVAVVNCCHGGVGEDGRLAALMDVVRVPITSCPPLAAMKIQSKAATRELLNAAGFPQPKFVVVAGRSPDGVVSTILETIGFPLIIKPNTLGSSIGITVAKTNDELVAALILAFELDSEVIVEQYLENIREVNCSAFFASDNINVSQCELVTNDEPILDFSAKYLSKGSGFVKKSAKSATQIPEQPEIQALTRRAYELFGARGIIRADFMVAGGVIYLNEINSVPGFLCYHLWLKSGIPYGTLISLVAEQSQRDAARTVKTTFPSEILERNRALVE